MNAESDAAASRPRVILLGASNVTRGISTVLTAAERACGQPLQVLTAIGRGRSYARPSAVFIRKLSGILECGLWPTLTALRPAPTFGLVTDLGNDILYGRTSETIAGWVSECLDRLQAADARIVLTGLPAFNLPRMGPTRFLQLRRLLFPGSDVSFEFVTQQAFALDEWVGRQAAERGIAVVAQQPDWYGFDPIHIRYRHWASAWSTILSPWSERPMAVGERGSLWQNTTLQLRVPEQRWIAGREQRGRQPAARLRSGTTVSFY